MLRTARVAYILPKAEADVPKTLTEKGFSLPQAVPLERLR